MAVEDAIHIDHRHYHENKHLLQQERPHILIIHQKIDDALHSEGSSRFSRVHPGSDEYHWFLKPLGSTFLWEEVLIEEFLIFGLFVRLVI